MNKDQEDDLTLNCSVKDVKPAMVSEVYPPLEVEKKNKHYADLLSIDYTGGVSEFTAIAQYANHEMRLTEDYCNIAKTILAISKTEMMHLQMLGSLITLLGAPLTYNARCYKKKHLWTPKYVQYKKDPKDMILADIKAEEEAIAQYRCHIKEIDDDCIIKVLERIIVDEEYHLGLFKECLKDLANS